MNTGVLRYGARVNTCPRCRAPYIDPKIVELAAVSERDRAGHRMKYAKQMDQRMILIAAAVVTVALSMFASTGLTHGFLAGLLMAAAVYAGINAVGFSVRYFIVFPKLTRESARRMRDTWYLTRLRACGAKAA